MSIFSGPRIQMPNINNLVSQGVDTLGSQLPEYINYLQNNQAGQAQLQTDITTQQSPQLAELMTQLFSQYGPQLNAIGNQINAQNIQSQADIASGAGKNLTQAALSNAKLFDPEYFNTRELAGNRISDLLGSIKLGSNLSGGERSEIERALNQEGMRRGTTYAPSQLDTVGNAMTYGQAGRNRELENQNALAQAISAATQFLPSSKSGFDTFSTSTGAGMGNQGAGLFTGLQDSGGGSQALDLGQGFYSGIANMNSIQAAPFTRAGGIGNTFLSSFANSLGSTLGSPTTAAPIKGLNFGG